jgi:hypothetical protein
VVATTVQAVATFQVTLDLSARPRRDCHCRSVWNPIVAVLLVVIEWVAETASVFAVIDSVGKVAMPVAVVAESVKMPPVVAAGRAACGPLGDIPPDGCLVLCQWEVALAMRALYCFVLLFPQRWDARQKKKKKKKIKKRKKK